MLRKKITPDMANIWLCNNTITKEEHTDFFVNYCFKAMVPEKLRKRCRLQEIQCNGHEIDFNPVYLSADECKELCSTLFIATDSALNLSKILSKHLRIVSANRRIDNNLTLKSLEKSLTFEEVGSILRAEMEDTNKGIIWGNDDAYCSARKMIKEYLTRLRRALLVCASVYQMTITYFGARI